VSCDDGGNIPNAKPEFISVQDFYDHVESLKYGQAHSLSLLMTPLLFDCPRFF